MFNNTKESPVAERDVTLGIAYELDRSKSRYALERTRKAHQDLPCPHCTFLGPYHSLSLPAPRRLSSLGSET
jgi:hypothetical protein